MITIKQAEQALSEFTSFNAGNLTAEWSVDYAKGQTYTVRSYGVPIAEICEFSASGSRGLWITFDKHSRTTSRHTALVTRAWANN
jgi:hypothetical protein